MSSVRGGGYVISRDTKRLSVCLVSSKQGTLPGHTWRDRPQIDQGNCLFLAGDWVAAPGLLSEVAFSGAVTAAEKAVDLLRSQSGRGGAAPAHQAFAGR